MRARVAGAGLTDCVRTFFVTESLVVLRLTDPADALRGIEFLSEVAELERLGVSSVCDRTLRSGPLKPPLPVELLLRCIGARWEEALELFLEAAIPLQELGRGGRESKIETIVLSAVAASTMYDMCDVPARDSVSVTGGVMGWTGDVPSSPDKLVS